MFRSLISDCWRCFDFLCSVWGIHFLRSPGHFHLTNFFPSVEADSIICLSISLPTVHCILEILLGFFSTKSLKFVIGYFGANQETIGLLQHILERKDLFFNFFLELIAIPLLPATVV